MKLRSILITTVLTFANTVFASQLPMDPCGRVYGYNMGITTLNAMANSTGVVDPTSSAALANSVILVSAYVKNLQAAQTEAQAAKIKNKTTKSELIAAAEQLRAEASRECNARGD